MSEEDNIIGFAIYLLSRGKSKAQVAKAIREKYIISFSLEQVTALILEQKEVIEQLSEDPVKQLKEAIKYKDLPYLNPLNRIESLSSIANKCSGGYKEQRLSGRGEVKDVLIYNFPAVISAHKAIKEEVESITSKESSEDVELIFSLAEPTQEHWDSYSEDS